MSNNLREVFANFGIGKKKKKRPGDPDEDDQKKPASASPHAYHRKPPSQRPSHQKTVSQPTNHKLPPSGHADNRDQIHRNQAYLDQLYDQRNQQRERAKRQQLNMAQDPNSQHKISNGTKLNNHGSSHSSHSKSTHSKHSSSSSSRSNRKRGHHPTRQFAHLKPEQFQQGISTEEIMQLMNLPAPPKYITDEKGYIEFQPGLHINEQWVILDTLGRGTFSKVFEAVDTVNQKRCAIKVIRNTHRYIEAAKTELRVLQHITASDDGQSSCIHLQSNFAWKNHPCFVFKLYGPSIYTVMSRNRFRPFPDSIVRSLIHQICNAIQFLHHLGIIFTDLKPENMVFVDGRTSPVKIGGKTHLIPLDSRIKIVDFGSAVYEPRYDPNNPKTWRFKDGYNYLIQTRHYRAPEVVLEMPWKRPVDIWSVGCVILEFLYGSMVFNTHCPIDHLHQMMKMIGPIPRELISASSDAKYKQLFHHPDGRLRLEDARRSRAQAKRLDHYFTLHKLEHRHLFDLVQRCLKWRAGERILGHQLLKHDYFAFTRNLLCHQHQFAAAPMQSRSAVVNNGSSSNKGHGTSSGHGNGTMMSKGNMQHSQQQ